MFLGSHEFWKRSKLHAGLRETLMRGDTVTRVHVPLSVFSPLVFFAFAPTTSPLFYGWGERGRAEYRIGG